MIHVKTSDRQRRRRDETARLGREIYERDILPQVEADQLGEYLAIDVETGEWAIDGSESGVVDRLRAQCPGAIDVLVERVGYRAIRSFGAGSLRRSGQPWAVQQPHSVTSPTTYTSTTAPTGGTSRPRCGATSWGYEVLKKWLSYRERRVLDRPQRPEEVQHFTDTVRRIAVVLVLTGRPSSGTR